MTLRNVNWGRAENMTPEERRELGINVDKGLVAIETHNSEYRQKGVVVDSVLEYLWSLE